MEQATSTLLAAFIGASAAIGGSLSLEMFKQRRERHAVARAYAGAIETELWAIKRRGYEKILRDSLAGLEAGNEWKFFGFPSEDQAKNPISEAYMGKVGLLKGNLPARTIHYFQISWGLKVDGSRLVSGSFGTDPALIERIVREDLNILIDIADKGRILARDLRASADGFWWPAKRLWRIMDHRQNGLLEQ